MRSGTFCSILTTILCICCVSTTIFTLLGIVLTQQTAKTIHDYKDYTESTCKVVSSEIIDDTCHYYIYSMDSGIVKWYYDCYYGKIGIVNQNTHHHTYINTTSVNMRSVISNELKDYSHNSIHKCWYSKSNLSNIKIEPVPNPHNIALSMLSVWITDELIIFMSIVAIVCLIYYYFNYYKNKEDNKTQDYMEMKVV